MKLKSEKLIDKGQGKWIVTIDGQEWKDALEKGKKRVASNIQIPGFRKGKVPKAKIDEYLTPSRYLNEALKVILEPAWNFAKESKSNVQPFNSPVPTPTKISEDICVIEFQFDLKPEIKIGAYKGIKSDKLKKPDFKVTKEEIDKAIDQYREKFVMEKIKEEAKVEVGDAVKFDFEGFVDGKAFPGGKGKDFILVIGSKQMIPGFEDEMVGKSLGECSINVTFPKDYTPELSGKKAEFKLNIHEIKERILPEKDDELAKDLGIKDVTTYKQLEYYIKKQIEKNKSMQLKNVFVNDVIREIAKTSTIEIPQSAIEKEVTNMYKEFEQRVAAQKLTMKEYRKKTGMTDEDIRKELFNDARERLESYLVTDEVRNKEKFDVSSEEINDKYNEMAQQFGVEPSYLSNLMPESQIKEEIIREKLVSFLFENNGN